MFNEEDIYNGFNDIKYLFSENESKITHNSNIKYIRCLFNDIEDKESPFKSIIEDIKRGLYYVQKMNNLSTSDIKNIKEKLGKFKNELFSNNNNNKIKKDPNESKGIKYIRYLFNEDKNKKSDPYKAEKIKNLVVKKLKILKIIINTKVLKISGICLMIIHTKVLNISGICLMKIIM